MWGFLIVYGLGCALVGGIAEYFREDVSTAKKIKHQNYLNQNYIKVEKLKDFLSNKFSNLWPEVSIDWDIVTLLTIEEIIKEKRSDDILQGDKA